jgi:hypothetical protein
VAVDYFSQIAIFRPLAQWLSACRWMAIWPANKQCRLLSNTSSAGKLTSAKSQTFGLSIDSRRERNYLMENGLFLKNS